MYWQITLEHRTMTKQIFKPNVEEDLNRLHNVSLTEGQISTILYILEGYNPLDSNGYDPECREDVDNILEKLEEVADNWKGQFAEPKVIDSQELEGDISTVKDSDYAEKVDRLVDNMGMRKYKWDEQFYNEIVKDSKFSYGKFNETNYPLHLQQQ